jgi:ABC-type amino acid transport substrate-binding protein
MTGAGAASPPAEAMRRGVSRGVFVATVVIVAIIALAAGLYVGKTTLGSSSSTASHFLVVGTNIPFPPFEDYNYTTGSYFGFDINFSMMIASALGRTLVIDNYANFAVLLTNVGAGAIDMGASAITESGATGALRNGSMSFSVPYYDANQAILVQSSSSLSCVASGCTPAQLETLKIAVQTGTSSQTWLQDFVIPNETKGGSVTGFVTVDSEVLALTAGAYDAVMIDLGPATAIAAGSGGALKIAGDIITNELYGFAVAHNDPEHLLPSINHVITQSMQNGTYAKLIREWFG